MRTIGWRMVAVASVAVLLGPLHVDPLVGIEGGTQAQRSAARWAMDRFALAGLAVPALGIRLHPNRDGCRGDLGYYQSGVVDVCAVHSMDMIRHTLLHEIAHAWTEANLTSEQRSRFMTLRGVTAWNDRAIAWELRGFEQAAEIIAWALHDEDGPPYTPPIPGRSVQDLSTAYRVLTGLPVPRAADPLAPQARAAVVSSGTPST
jgi:hypothetical protein